MEHQVYEFIFNHYIQDAVTPILIARSSDATILSRFTLEEILERLHPGSVTDPAMLSELIDTQHRSISLDWRPIMVNASYLDTSKLPRDGRGFWEHFHRQHPEHSGYYVVSEVVLKGNEAVVVIGYRCAALCGAHDAVFHVSKNGKSWRIEAGVRLWVS
ncbi:MAG: hypothetical protein AAF525_02180 [Pseudomonadota bacterium]